jgi:acyl-CoA synthetase (AMP-forming)/AMP-acid ligase II
MALGPLYLGARSVLFSPVYFLQKPIRWLQAVTRHRGTMSGGPNFAYDLCTRTATADQRAALDLHSWRIAFNGAEPVRAETLDRFAATFGPCGFRREALFPTYGLAEAALIFAGGDHTAAPVIRRFAGAPRPLVGCGRPWHGQRLAIVDPESRQPCPDGQTGEIWVHGPSVAAGYWNRPEATAETFGARLADGDGPFLRTGDLGLVDQGELFITGRLKDLIIIRGANYHPQDIEATVERSHPALRPGCGAAFSTEPAGEEVLVVVQEVERECRKGLDVRGVLHAVREAVAAEHGLRVHALVLLRTGSIPRTTSGKVRRRACRDQLCAGTLEVWGADYGDPDCRGPFLQ